MYKRKGWAFSWRVPLCFLLVLIKHDRNRWSTFSWLAAVAWWELTHSNSTVWDACREDGEEGDGGGNCLCWMPALLRACCSSQGHPSLQIWTWPAPPPSGPQRPPAQPGPRSGFPNAQTCALGCWQTAWWVGPLPGSSYAGLECAAALGGCGSGRWRCSGSPPCTTPPSPHRWTAAPPRLRDTSAGCAPDPSDLPPPPLSPRGPARSARSWRKCCWVACWSGTWWYTPLDGWSSGVGAQACGPSPLGGHFASWSPGKGKMWESEFRAMI